MESTATVFDQFADLKKKKLGMVQKKSAEAVSEPKTSTPARVRTIGNLDTMIESQRIYNPSIPPTNPAMKNENLKVASAAVKSPPQAQIERGTASASDIEGRWGTPEKK